MSLLLRTLALICLVLLFIFCVSNREPMVVRFLSWESPELPVFLLLVFAFLTGAMLALLGQALSGVAHRRQPPASGAEKTPKLSRREKKARQRQAETATDDPATAEPVAAPDAQPAPTEPNKEIE